MGVFLAVFGVICLFCLVFVAGMVTGSYLVGDDLLEYEKDE